MDKKYAIFDMDGTLIDSMGTWTNLFKEFFEARGITTVPENLEEKIKTMTISQSSAYCVKTFSLKDTPEEIISELNDIMTSHYQKDIPLKKGVLDLLTQLKAKGVKMCVASATAKPLIIACLERLGVLKYFEFILSCEEVGTGKNKPDVYLEAARRLGVMPFEIAVYEDAYNAVETASKAGFYTVGVYDCHCASQWNEISKLADETIRL